jgi:hypothetical protein
VSDVLFDGAVGYPEGLFDPGVRLPLGHEAATARNSVSAFSGSSGCAITPLLSPSGPRTDLLALPLEGCWRQRHSPPLHPTWGYAYQAQELAPSTAPPSAPPSARSPTWPPTCWPNSRNVSARWGHEPKAG